MSGPLASEAGLARFDRLTSARSVALVGVKEESFWSQHAVRNATAFGFDGAVHLVHPTRARQFDRTCAPSLTAIGEPVDLVLSLTGADRLEAVLHEAAEHGVRAVVSIASGLAERGDEGRARQDRLVRFAAEHDIALLGPNCVGFVDYHSGLAPFTDRISAPMPAGPIGVLSQSGALLQLIHRSAQRAGIGLGAMFSLGNAAQTTAVDLIEGLVSREDIRCVAGYLEGIPEPRRFLQVAERALELGKPIVLLKAGRSQGAARLAMAHTGSMTGDDRVVDAMFEKYGVLRVSSPEELIETAGALSRLSPSRGRRLAVLSSSGGACSIAADLLEGRDLELPLPSAETTAELASKLPDFGTPQNPLDTTGVIVDQPHLLGECLSVIAGSGEYDQILVNLDLPPEGPGDDIRARLDAVAAMCAGVDIPVVLSSTIAGDVGLDRRAHLAETGQHLSDGLVHAVEVAEHLARYGRARALSRALSRTLGGSGDAEPTPEPVAIESDLPALAEFESVQLLERFGLSMNDTRLVRTAAEAAAQAADLGFPLVAKIHSSTVLHKSDIGGVKVGLADEAEVLRAFEELMGLADDHDVEGVLLAPLVQGVVAELIAGVVVQDGWDPVIAVGSGGIYTEVLQDVATAAAPLTHASARELLDQTRASVMLSGVRGQEAVDLEPVVDFLVGLSRAATAMADDIAAIDVNPLFVGRGFAVAGDALVVLKERAAGDAGVAHDE